MTVYVILEAIIGIVLGLLLALRTKKSENVVYGKLDKLGFLTNIFLACAYVCFAPIYLFLGLICYPAQQGFLGIIGGIISIIAGSAALISCLGIGYSVALRKKGKSNLSFVVQFAGVVAIALTIIFYIAFEGTLLVPLN
jgi:hypothetical protein